MATVKKTPPVDSKGNPKKYEPMFGGPLARGIANLSNRISENSSKIMEQSRQIELGKERAAKLAELKKKYPAPAYKGTFAPLKPMSFISQTSAPKAAPAARPAAPVAKAAPKASAPVARTAAPVAKAPATRSMEPIKPMASLSVSASETQPMGKREVDLSISTKKGNLFQRLGERVKQRQLARASKSVGTPMKSTTSIPSTPTPSAPQTESGQRLSAVGKAMLDKYMSKKYMGGGKMEYMGGGKMKKYAKGGMIEKNKVKPTSDSTYYYANKEYISNLKALTATSKQEMDKQFALQDKAKHDRWRQGNKGKPGYDKNGFLIKNETTKTKKYAKGGMIEKEGAKPKKKTAMDGLKALGKYVSTFGLATEGYNPAEGRYPKKKVEVKNQESLKKYKYGGKMDKKKAFLEMIAKLKAKKK